MAKAELIVALDVERLEEAERLAKLLYPTVKLFKIGSQLYTAYGPEAVRTVGGLGARIFLDLKFHDIPNTVRNAVFTGMSLSYGAVLPQPDLRKEVQGAVGYPVFMMTVHAVGGEEMMRYAADAALERASALKIERPKLVAITVLTSDAAGRDTQKLVVERALSARKAGLDGVVCSVHEAAAVRKECGKGFIIVTPGIRIPRADWGDQKRVASPADAVAAGSDYLVVGRPILEAKDPLLAAKNILKTLKKA